VKAQKQESLPPEWVEKADDLQEQLSKIDAQLSNLQVAQQN